jgi:hypothetical protein
MSRNGHGSDLDLADNVLEPDQTYNGLRDLLLRTVSDYSIRRGADGGKLGTTPFGSADIPALRDALYRGNSAPGCGRKSAH